jgi:hypothetical protein
VKHERRHADVRQYRRHVDLPKDLDH